MHETASERALAGRRFIELPLKRRTEEKRFWPWSLSAMPPPFLEDPPSPGDENLGEEDADVGLTRPPLAPAAPRPPCSVASSLTIQKMHPPLASTDVSVSASSLLRCARDELYPATTTCTTG